MVKIQEKSDYDKLDEMVAQAAEKHGLKLDITGWTRKTYDVYRITDVEVNATERLARVESFATTNGEITIYHADAMPFAQELGAAMEAAFAFEEAVVVEKLLE